MQAMQDIPVQIPPGGIPWDSPSGLSSLLEQNGLAMSKKFGQNFLINAHARQSIVDHIAPRKDQTIWEVGPGLGAITHLLLEKAGHLVAFEIDRGFIRILKELHGANPGFTLVEGDVLKTAAARWGTDGPAGLACICGNLPYNAASGFIMDCLEAERRTRMVFTVQKEAAERMCAPVDGESYSSFSVHCQARHRVAIPETLGPGLFWPAPDVTSAVVTFDPLDSWDGTVPRHFNVLVRSTFASRRKTLLNNLKASPLAANPGLDRLAHGAESLGIALSRRAETLSPAEFLAWARTLE